MWARWTEVACGLWLAASAMLFAATSATTSATPVGVGVGVLVIALAGACHWHPLRRAHLALLTVAPGLAAAGWWSVRADGDAYALHQTWLVTGLVLAMTGLVPSRANTPPESWPHDVQETPR